jgi:hypothetical protein
MKLWNRDYTKNWLARQGLAWSIFLDSVDGAKLHLLAKLSFDDFKLEFLKGGNVMPKTEWIRLKELTKDIRSDEVKWPKIVHKIHVLLFDH